MIFGELRSWIEQRQIDVTDDVNSIPDKYKWRLGAEYLGGYYDAFGDVYDKINKMERLEKK